MDARGIKKNNHANPEFAPCRMFVFCVWPIVNGK